MKQQNSAQNWPKFPRYEIIAKNKNLRLNVTNYFLNHTLSIISFDLGKLLQMKSQLVMFLIFEKNEAAIYFFNCRMNLLI